MLEVALHLLACHLVTWPILEPLPPVGFLWYVQPLAPFLVTDVSPLLLSVPGLLPRLYGLLMLVQLLLLPFELVCALVHSLPFLA